MRKIRSCLGGFREIPESREEAVARIRAANMNRHWASETRFDRAARSADSRSAEAFDEYVRSQEFCEREHPEESET